MKSRYAGPPVQGVLFDKDGTLFDFNATWGAVTRILLETETAQVPDRLGPLADALGYDLATGLFRKDSLVIAGTADEVVAATLPFVPETSPEALIARFSAVTSAAPQVEVTPLVAFVAQLKAAGLKIGVATNDAESPARAHLAQAHIEGEFDFIAGYDSGYGGKPAPGQLLAFCDVVDVPPKACVMVGDSTHDLHAGAAAGMTTVAVLTGVAEAPELAPYADVVLPSIADLPEWLGISGS